MSDILEWIKNNAVIIIFIFIIGTLALITYYKSHKFRFNFDFGLDSLSSETEKEEDDENVIEGMAVDEFCPSDPDNPHQMSQYTCSGMFVRLSYMKDTKKYFFSIADLSHCVINPIQSEELKKKQKKVKATPKSKVYNTPPPIECSKFIAIQSPVNDTSALFTINLKKIDPVSKKSIYTLQNVKTYSGIEESNVLNTIIDSRAVCFDNSKSVSLNTPTTGIIFEQNPKGLGYALKILFEKSVGKTVNVIEEYYIGELDQTCPDKNIRFGLHAEKAKAIYFTIEPDETGIIN